MPEQLKAEEVNSKTDPTVAKQYDESTPVAERFDELYSIVDKLKIGMLGTYRNGTGPVHRSMGVAKRTGPDFLFIANHHSKKFSDLADNKEATITFQDSSTQNWVSITGDAVTTDNKDPRIKELYNPATAAWFGDLGDGVHNGKAEDPRMALIEVKSKYITYWKAQVGTLGFMKEIAQATFTGKVADVGVLREMTDRDIEGERSRSQRK